MKKREEIDWSQEPPSKSQLKRDMIGIQKLGEDLTTLGKKQLDKLPISESLRAALAEFNRLPNSHEARRRQLQFIGKVMRDANHEEIQSELDKLRTPDRTQVRRAQLIEEWGEKILSGSEEQISAFLEHWPLAQRQVLRQMVRNYSTDNEEIARVHRRKLLNYIKEFIE
jgi:ribosome-associated protein